MSKNKQSGNSEKKEQKIIYIDDGHSIANMSGTYGKRGRPQKSTFREKMRTFFGVMKQMIVPMLCTLIAFTLVFILILAATGRL